MVSCFYSVVQTFQNAKHSRNNSCSLRETVTSYLKVMKHKQYSVNKTRDLLKKLASNILETELSSTSNVEVNRKGMRKVILEWSFKKYKECKVRK
jgi:hypothetical protein